MRVTDHTNYQSSQNMRRRFDGNDPVWHKSNEKEKQADGEVKSADQKEEAAAGRSVNSAGKKEEPGDPIRQLKQRAESAQKAFAVSRHSTLYTSTSDLMAIANTENQEILRAIYVRLSFKLWSVRAAGVTNTDTKAVKSAARSIQKVMGKVKGKIKSLQKEDEMEKKAEAARKAKQRRLQQEIRRQLAIKRKIRKNKEQKDIADSYLESDGQYSVKGYRDSLPEEVLLEMEMQQSGGAGISDLSLSGAEGVMAVDSSVVSMSAEAAVSAAAAGAGGAFIDMAL